MTGPERQPRSTRPISVAELLAKNGTIGAPPRRRPAPAAAWQHRFRHRRRTDRRDPDRHVAHRSEHEAIDTENGRGRAAPSRRGRVEQPRVADDEPRPPSSRDRAPPRTSRTAADAVEAPDAEAETEAELLRPKPPRPRPRRRDPADPETTAAVADYDGSRRAARRRPRPAGLPPRRTARTTACGVPPRCPAGGAEQMSPDPVDRRRGSATSSSRRDRGAPTTARTTRTAFAVVSAVAAARCSAARPSPTTWPGAARGRVPRTST